MTDLVAYLKAVFVETWQMVFTFLDILGLVLFFWPRLASNLVGNEPLVKTIGGSMFFVSFLWANFSLYRRAAEATLYQAEIRLEVMEKEFSPSHSGRFPFGKAKTHQYGFDAQGLPDWGSLWASIKVTNIGYEPGQLRWELDEAKTRLPPLFASDKAHIEFYAPPNVKGRSSSRADLFFDVLFTEQDPSSFAQALKYLVESKKRYQIGLRYQTIRIDSESKVQELYVRGDFSGFHQKVLEYWDGHNFKHLADLARIH